MTLLHRILFQAWILATILACGFVLRNAFIRQERIERISEIGLEQPALDPRSPTGYAGGQRVQIIPERHAPSYQWIAQTQQMLARGEWRVRHVDDDNAPIGRAVHTASPYRWWLAILAHGYALATDEPIGLAAARAAVLAGPWLHVLAILVTAGGVARRFGNAAAAIAALGLALLYPLGGAFAAGQPDDLGLSCVLALWSVLLLIPATPPRGVASDKSGADQAGAASRPIFAGIVAGLGIWVNVRVQVPVVIGIALGAAAVAWLSSRQNQDTSNSTLPSWRRWSIAGAATGVAGYLCEYFPSHLDAAALRLEVNHPLYAVAWLGVGELLARLQNWARGGRFRGESRAAGALAVAAIFAVAAVPVTMLVHSTHGFLGTDVGDSKLGLAPESPIAATLWGWIARDGITLPLVATLMPCVAGVVAVSAMGWRGWSSPCAGARAFALGPLIVMSIVATARLREWSAVEALLLPVLIACLRLPATVAGSRTVWMIGVLAAWAPGLWLLRVPARLGSAEAVTESEAQALVERDVAYWLAARAGRERLVVLAPPNFAAALIYYGGHRALVTPYRENFDGFAGAARIAGATALAQAEALSRRREIDYILLPSWESDLADYARLGTGTPETTLIGRLQRWLPPLWLRPVAYKMPVIEGYSGRSLAIFAMTEMQDDPLALARLAEYFAEMSQPEFAIRVAETLRQKYPANLNGLVARAQVAATLNDGREFGAVLSAILPALERGEDVELPWDRRVSLAIILAQGKRTDLARKHLQICVDEADGGILRMLSTSGAIRMITLMRRLDLEWPDGELRDTAARLVPPELRADQR